MRNNFYPEEPLMLIKIQKCIEAGNLDTPMVFCKSCVFNLCIKSNEPACRTCIIRQGISKATGLRIINNMRKDEEKLSEIIDVLKSDGHCKVTAGTMPKRTLHHLRKIMAAIYIQKSVPLNTQRSAESNVTSSIKATEKSNGLCNISEEVHPVHD